MKSLFLIFPLITLGLIPGAEKEKTGAWVDHSSLYYFEGNRYLDLEVLKLIQPAGVIEGDFKKSSKFAFRFNAPAEWMNNFRQEAAYGSARFRITEKSGLEACLSPGAVWRVYDQLGQGERLDNIVGNDFLLETEGGIVRCCRLYAQHAYSIKKYDSIGRRIFDKQVMHTEVTIDGKTSTSNPYLYYFGCTPSVMVFISYDRDIRKTVTVSLKDGAITEYPMNIAGFIRDEDESNVPGFISVEEDKEQIKATLLNVTWTAPCKGVHANRAEILMKGDVLYVALYHGISTGSSLFAYKRSTGELIWTAEVKQLLVDHSEYYNTVYLSSWKDRIIMEGFEAGGHYVQVFDEKSGKRLFSSF